MAGFLKINMEPVIVPVYRNKMKNKAEEICPTLIKLLMVAAVINLTR